MNCVNYSMWNPKHSAKYVYHTGTWASSIARADTSCADGTEENKQIRQVHSRPPLDSQLLHQRKGDPTATATGRRKGITCTSSRIRSRRKCKKRDFLGIHDRFICDERFRKNMIELGRSEEICREMDKLANEDHTHRITEEEIRVYRNNWWIRSNIVEFRHDVRKASS